MQIHVVHNFGRHLGSHDVFVETIGIVVVFQRQGHQTRLRRIRCGGETQSQVATRGQRHGNPRFTTALCQS